MTAFLLTSFDNITAVYWTTFDKEYLCGYEKYFFVLLIKLSKQIQISVMSDPHISYTETEILGAPNIYAVHTYFAFPENTYVQVEYELQA